MDLPWGAFGAFLPEPVRFCFSSSCPGAAAFVDQKDDRRFPTSSFYLLTFLAAAFHVTLK
jgi:hypothetical protein